MASVQISNLCKTFERRHGEKLSVFEELSIEASHSEFVCLLGPSGCGKSTVLNILAQLAEADGGDICVDGESDYRRHTFGYVFQQPRLLNWMTVRQNLAFVLVDRGLASDEIERRTNKYLELVGLRDFADEYPLSLSGGMQQRVGIARALAIEPEVLLMDEPFSSLDELTARAMRIELLKIWEETQKTVLFVTHNPMEAVYLADRIYLLSSRPSKIVDTVAITVPRPRDIDDPTLTITMKQVLATLVGVGARQSSAQLARQSCSTV